MKNITLEEYQKQAGSLVFDVMAVGDIVRVDCGPSGAFVIMEEGEYEVMRDALKTLVASASMDDATFGAVLAAAKKAGLTGSEG